MKKFLPVLLVCLVVGLMSCATKVIRTEPEDVIDLSGRWNDTDSRMTAEEMIDACLNGVWLVDFNKSAGRDPVVIVGTIVNRTHEHINADVFIKDLEGALVNSGKVKFVSDKLSRSEVREERIDQQDNARVETQAELNSETGADFMLLGSVNSVKDETQGQYAILFQANLELIDLATNEKTWMGQKKIKKLVKRPKYSL